MPPGASSFGTVEVAAALPEHSNTTSAQILLMEPATERAQFAANSHAVPIAPGAAEDNAGGLVVEDFPARRGFGAGVRGTRPSAVPVLHRPADPAPSPNWLADRSSAALTCSTRKCRPRYRWG
jgi:hypothetical protein